MFYIIFVDKYNTGKQLKIELKTLKQMGAYVRYCENFGLDFELILSNYN